MKKLFVLIMVVAMSFNVFAKSPSNTDTELRKQFIAKVLKIDGHNVITAADMDGKLRFLSFAYIKTPVRGQPFFEEVQEELSQHVGQWLYFTVVKYGAHMDVQPVLARSESGKSINSRLIRGGFAKIAMETNPPPALIDQARASAEQKKRMWAEETQFSEQRSALSGPLMVKMFNHKGKNGLIPYLLDESTMNAYPVICMLTDKKKYPIVVTAHVAKRKGYTPVDTCPKK